MKRLPDVIARPTVGRLPRWLLVLPAAILVLGLAASAVHQHAGEDASHPCATCALSHATATPIVVASHAPVSSQAEGVHATPDIFPATCDSRATSSRGPPSV